jgi:hypothetical protein
LRRVGFITIAAVAVGLAALTVWPAPDAATLGTRPLPAAIRPFASPQPALDDSTFAALITGLSEPGGYFDTDNLISNESSYLHVIGALEQRGFDGGAYLGVGPDQNFSYMAAVRPAIAFIIDIRRDNLLQHLLFKALFELAPTRIEYVSLLFGRLPPSDPEAWSGRSIDDLVEYVDRTRAAGGAFEATQRAIIEHVAAAGVPLTDTDLATIARIHRAFISEGPGLRYNSHGRDPRPSYPSYRQLLLATDRSGQPANFLAFEDDYAFLRKLQQDNLVIPIVGDFAGDHALPSLAAWLGQAGYTVSAFYLSNVEFYLWQDGTFNRFARTVATLPFDERTLMIRSLFGRVYGHPQSLPGFNSTQLMQDMAGFVRGVQAGMYETYEDLIYRGYLEVR